ncbi:gamma-glutamylcyclotransferase family protein [Desulfotomaculum copahuensis]|uniref:Gamma-glutamylcyclotransferase n=1 Tax=Desulfotomaculum copahuensis TaxID=1838280 RepID=A0A1B7LCC2_9FIRM|nr:gamma-glutamylcyclotransferase family protein [Desulfotomaculum copahuensis]OAT80321.1 hypothetical protein A6M21_13800 [Desulfotomaculum copahuensis]
MSENLWYFAYGSNIDAERIKERIGFLPDRIPGTLGNWHLEFNKTSKKTGEGFANIVPCPGEIVEGVLYAVTEEELQKLDCYEGVPAHYIRYQINVVRQDKGEVVAAVTYVANPDKVRDGLKPTREYLNHLLAGKDYMSEKYIQHLRAVEILD